MQINWSSIILDAIKVIIELFRRHVSGTHAIDALLMGRYSTIELCLDRMYVFIDEQIHNLFRFALKIS